MSTHKRPLIGVTGPDETDPVKWFFLWLSLKLAGMDMMRLSPSHPQFEAQIDGLILSGGTDIDPLRYGKERKPNYFYDMPREDMEREWLRRAHELKLPIFGICRGAQLLNVFRGGSLYLDIRLVCETARYPGNLFGRIFRRKPVIVKQGSQMESILGARLVRVNSLHRQSLDAIGEGLEVTAWEENTIVQAVEGEGTQPFTIGVQWHPEYMPFSARQRNIFRIFAKHAKSKIL